MNKIFSKNIATIISILWGALILTIIFFKRASLINMSLNEIGDFLAGTFAPLGFFWLVAGFYQQSKGLVQNSKSLQMQGRELEKTTQALELQVREMKLALEQQTILTETTKQDLDLSKRSFEYQFEAQNINVQPFFHLKPYLYQRLHPYTEIDIMLANSRATCRQISIYYKLCNGDTTFHLIKTLDYVINNTNIELTRLKLPYLELESLDNMEKIAEIKIIFLDGLDKLQEHFFELLACKTENHNMQFKIEPLSISLIRM